jgi:alpha-L-fucosidase
MSKPSLDRTTEAKTKDKEEIEAKRREYAPFSDWSNKGILKDLKELFGMENPTLQHLLPIAQTMSHKIKEQLDRQDKRRREFVIGWLNKHYDQIRCYLPRMILRDDQGVLKGPHLDTWEKFEAGNPTADIFQYLNGEIPSQS